MPPPVRFSAVSSLTLALCILNYQILSLESCNDVLFHKGLKRNDRNCKSDEINDYVFQNVPILNGVYCFNNGTGICKAFAGRFEFYFNVWTQEFLGSVGKSQYVDSYGYHERVPAAYMIDGSLLYSDRPINWARKFTKNKPKEFNLLSSTSFNWCKYATKHNWPYKSAILDHDKVHQIFFFNRQSCIYNPKDNDLQHYNTRFLHKSKLRIDLEYNPTIFAMEDNKAGEIRLVKHRRQHWYEVKWKLLKNPSPGIKYFVEMDAVDKPPLIVDGKGPLLRYSFYNKTTDLCVSDYYTTRVGDNTNARLVPSHCGLDGGEIADYIPSKNVVYEVDLHSIPRWPQEAADFYGVKVRADSNWQKFASDGFSFSATTTIPLGGNRYRVISLFSWYQVQPKDKYDEHYPPTYLATYEMSLGFFGWSEPSRKRDESTKKLNLNYVDDIAYLHKCNTILVIFGPLYTEYKVDEFNLETKTPLASIYDLGLNEMTSAFFAHEDKIYFYHRLNFVAAHTYTCGSGGSLVTAKKVGNYHYKTSADLDIFKWIAKYRGGPNQHQEELHFEYMGMFKGKLGTPDAPDAANYPYEEESVVEPEIEGLPFWIYILIVIGCIVLLVMFILGFIAFKRYRRRRYLAMTQRSEMPNVSQLSGQSTNRSGVDRSRASLANATIRSGKMGTSRLGSTSTRRTSALSGRSPSAHPSSASTKRSSASKSGGSKRSASTKRSAIFSNNKSKPSTSGSSSTGGSSQSSRGSGKKK